MLCLRWPCGCRGFACSWGPTRRLAGERVSLSARDRSCMHHAGPVTIHKVNLVTILIEHDRKPLLKVIHDDAGGQGETWLTAFTPQLLTV
jgi:hypothetical protein